MSGFDWPGLLDDFAVGVRLVRAVGGFPGGGDPPAVEAATGSAAAGGGDRPAAAADFLTAPVTTFAGPVPGFILGPAGDGAGAFAMVAGPAEAGNAVGSPSLSAASGQYMVLFTDALDLALVIDMDKREILTGGVLDPALGGGDGDVLVLSGTLAGGIGGAATLPAALPGLEAVVVRPGASYDLASADGQVAAGATLFVNGAPLDAGESIRFDGSAETDGSFNFLGSGGDDSFLGGAGGDRIRGGNGADTLSGGGGADLFGYGEASESTGAGYDTLLDFDAAVDRIDLRGTVTGFNAPVAAGALSAATFDADLAAVLGADALGAGKAVLFTPDDGDLAGTLFLIVDANGEAGYQAGEDFVFALPNADPADLSSTGIFV